MGPQILPAHSGAKDCTFFFFLIVMPDLAIMEVIKFKDTAVSSSLR